MQYLELSKPGFARSLSRKDERIAKSNFLQGRRVSLPAIFLHYMLVAGHREGNSVNTHWLFVARVYPAVMAFEDRKSFFIEIQT